MIPNLLTSFRAFILGFHRAGAAFSIWPCVRDPGSPTAEPAASLLPRFPPCPKRPTPTLSSLSEVYPHPFHDPAKAKVLAAVVTNWKSNFSLSRPDHYKPSPVRSSRPAMSEKAWIRLLPRSAPVCRPRRPALSNHYGSGVHVLVVHASTRRYSPRAAPGEPRLRRQEQSPSSWINSAPSFL